MKIVTLLGSAKKKGNTATVLTWVEAELLSMGHEVERIYLEKVEIGGCLGCAKCRELPEEIGCVRKDDAYPIFEKMIEAEAVLFATPIYFWGYSAQMKALIDRGYSLVCNYHMPNHTSLVEGQRQALLVTGAGPYENNAEPLFVAFDRIVSYYKAVKAGELYVAGCSTPDQMPPKVKAQAQALARQIDGQKLQ